MVRHPSTEKRHRQSLKRNARNRGVRSRVRGALIDARTALSTQASDADARVNLAEKLLRRAATKRVLHPRTVSRTVARLRRAQNRAK
jgi:small subunit ribosomal protein S20